MMTLCCEPVIRVVRRNNGRALPFDQVIVPPVSAWHDDKAVYVEVEAPGFPPESIDITAGEGVITIRGERPDACKCPDKGIILCERIGRIIERTIPLPFPIDKERTTAEARDGVLFITLPRPAEQAPRKVRIQVG